MRLNLTVRHGHVNDGVRSYVEAKFAKLGRRLHDETLVEVVLDRERNPKIADDHVVEAEVHVKGPNLHGREAATTLRGGDRPARRQARAADRAPPRQEGAGAPSPRPRRAAGADARGGDRAVAPRGPRRLSRSLPLPHDPGPHWGEVGIHGIHRPREWDAVVTVLAPDLAGDELWFVALADGRVVVDDAERRRRLRSSASLDRQAPYRAHAVQTGRARLGGRRARDRDRRARRATRAAQFVELAWDGVERSVRIDGEPTLAGVPELERLGAERHAAYVVTAARLVDDVWEVGVTPL